MRTICPPYGFGRGFQSFDFLNRYWGSDRYDAGTVVDNASRWIERSLRSGATEWFYFVHVFDPHYPYIAIERLRKDRSIDVNLVDEYLSEILHGQPNDYLELLETDLMFDEDDLAEIRSLYRESVEYTARKLAGFISDLKRMEVFDEAFLIITGDHGEEFLERGAAGHATVHDANVRPGMILKPPSGVDVTVPDAADTLDFAPTILDIAGMDVPDQFAGKSWLSTDPDTLANRYRIVESIDPPDTYVIAVEDGENKAILVYESEFPDRPTRSQIDQGPIHEQYFHVESLRTDADDIRTPTESSREELRTAAREFLTDAADATATGDEIDISTEVENRLQRLGYK